jgi:hypothetical protein
MYARSLAPSATINCGRWWGLGGGSRHGSWQPAVIVLITYTLSKRSSFQPVAVPCHETLRNLGQQNEFHRVTVLLVILKPS